MNMKNEYVSPEIEIVSLGEVGTDIVSASGNGEWDLPEIGVGAW